MRQAKPSRGDAILLRPGMRPLPAQPGPWRRVKRASGPKALLLMAFALALPVQAQDAQSLQVRALASTCANCHGTDGQAVNGEAMVPLKGMDRAHLIQQMRDFREGRRPATVMHQIAKGFTPEQIEKIADYFAARR